VNNINLHPVSHYFPVILQYLWNYHLWWKRVCR